MRHPGPRSARTNRPRCDLRPTPSDRGVGGRALLASLGRARQPSPIAGLRHRPRPGVGGSRFRAAQAPDPSGKAARQDRRATSPLPAFSGRSRRRGRATDRHRRAATRTPGSDARRGRAPRGDDPAPRPPHVARSRGGGSGNGRVLSAGRGPGSRSRHRAGRGCELDRTGGKATADRDARGSLRLDPTFDVRRRHRLGRDHEGVRRADRARDLRCGPALRRGAGRRRSGRRPATSGTTLAMGLRRREQGPRAPRSGGPGGLRPRSAPRGAGDRRPSGRGRAHRRDRGAHARRRARNAAAGRHAAPARCGG